MRKIILAIFFSAASAVAFGTNDSVVEKVLTGLYQFRFEEATRQSSRLRAGSMEHGFSRINIAWWNIISGNDTPAWRKEFAAGLEEIRSSVPGKEKKIAAPDSLFYLINLHALAARIELLDKNYYQGASHLSQCIDLLKRSSGREEEYQPFLLTSGLYNYFMARAMKSYPFMAPYLMMYPKGNMAEGLQQLEKAARSENPVVSTEALYFLTKIHLEPEQNATKAREFCSVLVKRYPGNLLYRNLYFRTLLKQESLEPAIKELGRLKLECQEKKPASCSYFIEQSEKALAEEMIDRKKK